MNTYEENVAVVARREIAQEIFRTAVEAEKLRILTHRSLWSRLLAWLPFTISWKT